MKTFANLIFYLIPVIGMISGLSLGFFLPLLFLIILLCIHSRIQVNLANFIGIEEIFILLLIISSVWSIAAKTTFVSMLKILPVYFLTKMFIQNIKPINTIFSLKQDRLIVSLFLALIVFYLEYFSGGIINTSFRQIIKNTTNPEFFLHYLDRGCAIAALFSWVIIAESTRKRNYILAFIIYAVSFITLYLSDNLAAFVAFATSGLVFILTKFTVLKRPKLISLLLISFSIIFLYSVKSMDSYKISEQADFLPMSAKHRLFIWDFAMKKISDNPFLGIGHANSRNIEVKTDDMIVYYGEELHPMPIHPHNNLVQITLENGLIGLTLLLIVICKMIYLWNGLFLDRKTRHLHNVRAAGYAAFSTYFIIGLISFNMWQSWWIYSLFWLILALNLVVQKNLSRLENSFF